MEIGQRLRAESFFALARVTPLGFHAAEHGLHAYGILEA